MIWLTLIVHAQAQCPSEIDVLDQLTCSSDIDGIVYHDDISLLGGECADGLCYTCGEPNANDKQIAPEAVYPFYCQQSGDVSLVITNLPCDLDIYVIDDSCDPYSGCLYGSTAPFSVDDSVNFTCEASQTYYIVVEAYGTAHLDAASGPCTTTGDATGEIFDPTYTLSFDVSASTGCAEDCDDGIDNDLDSVADCGDTDCLTDPICCDLDADGVFSDLCNGDDCDDDDETVFPGAEDIAGDGIDQDCDGFDAEIPDVEEDTGSYAEPELEPEPEPEPVGEVIENPVEPEGGTCGCAQGAKPAAGWFAMLLGIIALGRRRR